MVELRKRPPPKESLAPAPPTKKGSRKAGVLDDAPGLEDLSKKAVPLPSLPTTSAPIPKDKKPPGSRAIPGTAEPIEPPVAAPMLTTAANLPSGPAPALASMSGGDAAATRKFAVGSRVPLILGKAFGGEIQTNDGVNTNLSDLINNSGEGVVIFTYPKASTPGCTTQACLFRDSYKSITDASYAVYGLSTDSPKSNNTFVTKHSLPYPLLCDPDASLTSAIGMKKPGPGKSTSRGVVVFGRDGVVKVWEQAGPQKTLDVVLDYLKNKDTTHKGPRVAGSAIGTAGDPMNDLPVVKVLSAVPAGLKEMDDGPVADTGSPYIKSPDVKMMEAPLARTPSMAEQEAAETALEVSEVARGLDVSTPASSAV